VLIGVELAAILYLVGGIGLSRGRRPAFGRWRAAAFWLGLLSILLALQSPIEVLARQLFWVHMVQHLLLMVVAAPLLALASPWTRLWRALPLGLRRSVARPVFRHRRLGWLRAAYQQVSRPSVIWVLAAANLWLWHLPPIYNMTLTNHLVHHLEHSLFLLLGIAFWAHLIDQRPFRAPLGTLARAGYVFLAMVQSWGLAGVLSFATGPFYSYALLPSRPGDISALTDQQLGGGMMWVPGAITYSIALLVFLFRWLAEEDLRGEVAARAEQGQAHGG
jgi:cytochrome c oxidase assembly factor CtaG